MKYGFYEFFKDLLTKISDKVPYIFVCM
jgi:hypothetical protein